MLHYVIFAQCTLSLSLHIVFFLFLIDYGSINNGKQYVEKAQKAETPNDWFAVTLLAQILSHLFTFILFEV